VLAVRRPFAAADLTYADQPGSGAGPVAGYMSTERALYSVDPTGTHLVAGRQPGLPSGDQDLATQLPELVARHLAAATGTRLTVAGRRCRVFRFLEPPSGPVKPLAGSGDHDDVCLDGAGLVLSEVWHYRGGVVYGRRATEVTFPGEPLPQVPASGGGGASAPTLVPDTTPRSFLAPPPAPPGFHGMGSFDFRLPDPQNPAVLEAASVVWSFADGPDLVTVEAGTEAGGALPWQGAGPPGTPVTLAGLGPGWTAIRSDGAEVRIDLGHGEWVRVRGTEAASWLARYAGVLARQD
jgi:hypothetical protein